MVNIFQLAGQLHKELMYLDRCDIYTYEDVVDEDGAISTMRSKKVLYENVPCKVSFSLRTWDTFDHKPKDSTPYVKQPKLFLETKYICKPGYFFKVVRFAPGTNTEIVTYQGQGGVPQVSWSHQEILMDVWGSC